MANWYGKDGGKDGKDGKSAGGKEGVHERHAREREETHARHQKARDGLHKMHQDELAQLAERQAAEAGAENTSAAGGAPQEATQPPSDGIPSAAVKAAAGVSGAQAPA